MKQENLLIQHFTVSYRRYEIFRIPVKKQQKIMTLNNDTNIFSFPDKLLWKTNFLKFIAEVIIQNSKAVACEIF